MALKHSQPWIPLEKIELYVQYEPALIILGLALSSWLISKLLLGDISEERKRTLRSLFRNLAYHLTFASTFFATYIGLQELPYEGNYIERLMIYVGLGTIATGAIVFVKVWRILVFEYLFLSHMRVAFPVLLVNLFTLLLSLILAAWLGAEVFNIRLTPILATSAIFSLVLGLAVQDTLGNLFAGVALQFDKPYGIGDWIEVQSSGHKWIGQVYEISWRATVLVSSTEELITVPNRVMSQAQISNFSSQHRTIIRSLLFKLPFDSDIQRVKEILLSIAKENKNLLKTPPPQVLISEATESWITFKLTYHLDDYGLQFKITDELYSKALVQLRNAGFELSGHRVVFPVLPNG